ncbi:MAG TPA: hypothetical protein VM430_17215, partial [Microbacterium sp.]|nr:hypothetical protein [Microbacterium sp.]
TEMFVNPAPGWFSGRGPVEHASGGLTFAVRGQQGAGTKDLSYGIRMPSPKALGTGNGRAAIALMRVLLL